MRFPVLKRRTALPLTVAVLALTGVAASEVDLSDSWRTTVLENIRSGEYRYHRLDDGSWSAPNRAHGLRCSITASGGRALAKRPAVEIRSRSSSES